MSDIRKHRVDAFCAWIATLPPNRNWAFEEAFRFFADLTGDELAAAMIATTPQVSCELDREIKQ